ncbi:PREDICTED: uncharacterized protein LOC105951196 [Erythranthe guttata]|uniref:uncharacterized protein LOC105951196 n=1 Tax=Erythranthe guttata TaxID=4155 RepID=UPI00064DB24B|nr:PREDICTED: uncharacterized protein LOC105951196 [Erythranthe guttata]|eukprot:XP_012830039.1 PREDICTED: uncharacterized protein LOC105951196 [Erythranthe guttata]
MLNEAEYEALIVRISLALAAGAHKLIVHSDSKLVVNQVLGTYEAKEESMAKYLALALTLLSKLDSYEIKQVPRANNIDADKLARLGSSMESIGSRKITLLTASQPEIVSTDGVNCAEENEPCWITPITNYLKSGELPTDIVQAKKIKIRAARFLMVGEELYKRAFSFPYLKCLNPSAADYVLREVHEGICGNHLSGKNLALKILRQGYYWPTMHEDAKRLVQRCNRLTVPYLLPNGELTWSVLFHQQLEDATVDYFTKWVEAEPLARIREEDIIQFLWKNIVCRFRIPRSIISDNGTQFCGDKVQNWSLGLSIKQFFTSVVNSQANGQNEVTNRTILQYLKSRLGSAMGKWRLWHQIGEPSWRVINYSPEENKEAMRANIDLVDELREIASIRQQMYKSRMAKAYNSKVRLRSFQIGDLVLRKTEASRPIGKLDPKWHVYAENHRNSRVDVISRNARKRNSPHIGHRVTKDSRHTTRTASTDEYKEDVEEE